ncbi:DHA2 family efflux MFS transporter permease subunit [Fructobacillus tropaeoli]|uniref:DHA2 family efflux MFS transporter permease subunit n=1 Tax=Fructobacillus tropaeoli TaxID=709323 RepID=UPI001455FB07|nr:DHA2 family efflux MFS transporter permease subunit [Fructobacillus tropaeoli]NLS38373.1 DHA2 family efflux MFS transporter permease subunit [Fructobacillus tropaeoli]
MNYLTKKEKGIFSTVMLMSIVSTIMATALSAGIPSIMTYFHISAGSAQWVTSLYSLVSGIMILITAFIIKRFPTRPTFLIGAGTFTIGTLIGAIAPTYSLLIIGRLLQGTGNGLVLALTQVIILKIFPKNKQGFGMGLYGLAVGLTPVIAPFLAGILIDIAGWRLIFYVVLIFCALDLIAALLFMDNILEKENSSFDISSVVYAAIGFTGVIYGLGNIGNYSITDWRTGLSLAMGVVFLVIFYKKQLKMQAPLLNVRTFKNKKFTISVLISFLLYAILNGTTTVLPIYMQSVQEQSATDYGLVMMPAALLIGFLSPIAGNIYDKYGMRILGLIGSFALVIFALMASLVSTKTNFLYIIVTTIFQGIGVAALMTPIMTWGLKQVPQSLVTDGTAIINCLRTIGGALGSAIFAAIITLISSSATITGIKASFIAMAFITLFLFIIALFFIKNDQPKVSE